MSPYQPTVTEIHLNNIIACLIPTVTLLNQVDGAFDIPFIQAISNTAHSLITALQIKSETAGSLLPATLYHVGKFTEYVMFYSFGNTSSVMQTAILRRASVVPLLCSPRCSDHGFESVKISFDVDYILRSGAATHEGRSAGNKTEVCVCVLARGETTAREGNEMSEGQVSFLFLENVRYITAAFQPLWLQHKAANDMFAGVNEDFYVVSESGCSLVNGTFVGVNKRNRFHASLVTSAGPGVGRSQCPQQTKYIPSEHFTKYRHFLRHNTMETRSNCQAGLEEALKAFKAHFMLVEASLLTSTSVTELQKKTDHMHEELLELVANVSDGTISDRSSSVCASSSLSKQPVIQESDIPEYHRLTKQPKIFHGRHSELKDIVTCLTQQSANIAILGPGGIGKTSLAKAALHHSQIAAKYQDRFFIATESATNNIELAALIGSHLALKPGKDLTNSVIQYLSEGPPCLLVLDNLEMSWEPLESCGGVEDFLSLLTDITHLALIITMRGAERPAKTFIEIADDFHDSKDIDQLLQLTDNMPLAVNPIAHLVDYECCSDVLLCWETEKTALLSSGNDKRSSLDASIDVSLASPHMMSSPGAKDLLSLLSILPDGLSDIELFQCNLPIQNIMGCRAILLGTSLAYYDDKQQLKSLVPPCYHQAEVKYNIEMLDTIYQHPIANPELLIAETLAHFYQLNDPGLEAQFYNAVGHYQLYFKRDLSAAAKSLGKALSLARSCEDSKSHLRALIEISWLKYKSGDYAAAQMHAHGVQQFAWQSTDLYQEANALRLEAACLMYQGDLKEALVLSQRAKERLHLCGMQGGELDCSVMGHLAEVHLLKSEYLEARHIHMELSTGTKQHKVNNARTLLNIVEIDIIIATLADLNLREGNTVAAKDFLQQGLKTAWGHDPDAVSYCLERLGNVTHWTSTGITWSDTWTVIYLVHAKKKAQETLALHKALCFMGTVYLSKGDEHTAPSLFVVALQGFTYMDIHRSRADCMLHLGDIAKHRGDLVRAAELWKEARPLFAQSSQAKDIAQIDIQLASIDQVLSDTLAHLRNLKIVGLGGIPTGLKPLTQLLATGPKTFKASQCVCRLETAWQGFAEPCGAGWSANPVAGARDITLFMPSENFSHMYA
ncbi:hypothetical protein C8R44DRAFT_746900 [Mycena epipterygia]|nr:hypothetical protein C8R44DRAFT_746900 [Mycena epipterygia]